MVKLPDKLESGAANLHLPLISAANSPIRNSLQVKFASKTQNKNQMKLKIKSEENQVKSVEIKKKFG